MPMTSPTPSSGPSASPDRIDRLPVRHRADLAERETVPLAQRLPHMRSTFDVFDVAAQRWPSRTAISHLPDGDPAEAAIDITYATLRDRIVQAANLFESLGLGADDCVVYLLPIVPEAHYCIWGAQAICRVAAINHYLEPAQMAELLKALDATVIVTASPSLAPDLWAKVVPLLPTLPGVRATFLVGGAAGAAPEGTRDFAEALAGQPTVPRFAPVPDPERVAACFHTGGTTGKPKIAQLNHRSLVVNSWMLGEMFDMQPSDVVVCGLPLFHVNGVVVTGLAVFMSGARVLLAGRNGFRNPALIPNFWKLVERFRVTTFSGVPTVYAALLNVPIGEADITSLRFGICGAAPMPVETFNRFEKATGIRLLEGFGMTETTACASVNPRDGERRVGSVGLPVPYTRMKTVLLDADGAYVRDADTDEIGVVAIQGPHLIPGYRDARHNAGLWLPGEWLNTGDLGRQDADGYFWLCGRAKDLIIRGGHNIDPSMIEETLARHPDVALAAAVGQPDAYAGELPVAYVTLRPGATADAEALKAFARSNVTERAAAPAWVECIDTMPVTAVGKIFKPALRKRAIERALRELFDAASLPVVAIRVQDDPQHGVVALADFDTEAQCRQAEELAGTLTVKVRCTLAGRTTRQTTTPTGTR